MDIFYFTGILFIGIRSCLDFFLFGTEFAATGGNDGYLKEKTRLSGALLHFYGSQRGTFVVLHSVGERVPGRAAQHLAAASVFLVRFDDCVGGSGVLLSEADAEKPEHRRSDWRTERESLPYGR